MGEDVIVIGAGPAGLAIGACLRRAGLFPLLLERSDRIAPRWHAHYDRLVLHTARGRSGLPYLAMPRRFGRYPTRADLLSYLDEYAEKFDLRPRFGTEVSAIRKQGAEFEVATSAGAFRARAVVMATGLNDQPNRPSWPGFETFPGPVLHTSDYRNPGSVSGSRILVIGFGNSGGDIALDLAEDGRTVDMSVRGPVNLLPKDLFGIPITSFGFLRKILPYRVADALTAPVLRMKLGRVESYGLIASRKGPAAQIIEDNRIPLIDVGTLPAIRAGRIGVRPAPQTFDGAECRFTDGTTARYDAVVLATGYRVDLRALLPGLEGVLNPDGTPATIGGATAVPGLYFLSYRNSADGQLRQIGIEARAIATDLAGRWKSRTVQKG